MSWHRNYAKFCEKKSQNRRNQGFSYYFCLMLEGSGSGSIPLTNGTGSGSGSWRPKNMWIRGIWIRIRIRNTAVMCIFKFLGHKFFFDLYFINTVTLTDNMIYKKIFFLNHNNIFSMIRYDNAP